MFAISHDILISIRLLAAFTALAMATVHFHRPNAQEVHRKCFEYVLNSNIRHADVVVVWSGADIADSGLIGMIMEKTHVIILNGNAGGNRWRRFADKNTDDNNDTFAHQVKTGDVFAIAASISSLDHTIDSMSKQAVHNSRGYFVIYLLRPQTFPMGAHSWPRDANDSRRRIENGRSDEAMERDDLPNRRNIIETLRKAFRILWSRDIFNAVVMLCGDSAGMEPAIGKCTVFTWFPYDERSSCGNVIEHFVKIDECAFDARTSRLMFHYAGESKLYYGEGDCSANECPSGEQNGRPTAINPFKIGDSGPREPTIHGSGAQYDFKVVNMHARAPPAHHINASKPKLLMELQGEINYNAGDDAGDNDTGSICNGGNSELSETKLNLCYSSTINPVLLLHAAAAPLSRGDRERDQNHKLASKFFEYDYRPFGTIEFRENDDFSKRFSSSNHNPHNNNRRPVQRTIPNILRPHFYEKIPSDMSGCKFGAAVVVWPPFVTPPTARFYGLEHKLIRDVARHMNVRMLERYVPDGSVRIQSESMKNLLANMSCDFAFGNLYPVGDMHKSLDTSIGYLYDHVNWIVPLGQPLPAWTNLINCFR